MSSTIKAPWTPQQVERLKRHQAAADQGITHPYTCPGDRPECNGHRELVPTPEGWTCYCGQYRQDWAHAA